MESVRTRSEEGGRCALALLPLDRNQCNGTVPARDRTGAEVTLQ